MEVLIYGTVLHGGGECHVEIRTGVFLHYAVNWMTKKIILVSYKKSKSLGLSLGRLWLFKRWVCPRILFRSYDDSAKHESVSPENMFSDSFDRFSDIPDKRFG